MEAPTSEDVRRALAPLDARRQKIVAGLFGVMIRDPARVRDREWVCAQLAEVTVMAGEFEADSPDAGVHAVRDYLEHHADELLRASFVLFQRVGLDLAPRASGGFTFDEALRRGLGYLPSIGDVPESVAEPVVRELGEQPLARLMAECGLKPKDLVAASTEQLTHKMVKRAMTGRRLTANTMGKVHRAWNRIGGDHAASELFDYEP